MEAYCGVRIQVFHSQHLSPVLPTVTSFYPLLPSGCDWGEWCHFLSCFYFLWALN